MKKAVSLSCSVLASALSVLVSPAVAQDNYPAKPVRILVGFSPGGSHDIFARIIARKLTETWGQSVIVDNRPGANGMIATETLAKAPPDGHSRFSRADIRCRISRQPWHLRSSSWGRLP